jgi:hypothetical protein
VAAEQAPALRGVLPPPPVRLADGSVAFLEADLLPRVRLRVGRARLVVRPLAVLPPELLPLEVLALEGDLLPRLRQLKAGPARLVIGSAGSAPQQRVFSVVLEVLVALWATRSMSRTVSLASSLPVYRVLRSSR